MGSVFKLDEILHEELKTLRDYTTGGRRPAQLAGLFGTPVLLGVLTWIGNPSVAASTAGSLLAVVGIFTGLLFQVTVAVLGSIESDRQRREARKSVRVQYRDLLLQLHANIMYSIVVGLVACTGIAAMSMLDDGKLERACVSLLIVGLSHFGLSLLMVVRRFFVVGQRAAD